MGDADFSNFNDLCATLRRSPRRWLITGVAGFIGSHLLEELLQLDQEVCGVDNFATGFQANLDQVCDTLSRERRARFDFIEGSITDPSVCKRCCSDVDIVLHQAALGSVPRSVADPVASNRANVDGFLEILLAARDAGIKRFIYASSSSVYGDSPELPKVESRVGQPLSPYAVTKATNELYAHAMSSLYEMQLVGFRYFNVFGPRQDPAGAYAAVVPKWIKLLQDGKDCEVYGDGETSRDFCFVKNVVEANLRAALISLPKPCCEVYNVACGEQTSLNQLYALLSEGLVERGVALEGRVLQQRPFRAGDVRHSLADITLARQRIGYSPRYSLRDGVVELLDWAVSHG